MPPISKTLPFPSETFRTKKNREERTEKWNNISSFHHKENSPAGKRKGAGNGGIIYSMLTENTEAHQQPDSILALIKEMDLGP